MDKLRAGTLSEWCETKAKVTVGTKACKDAGKKGKQAGIRKAEINGNEQWERSLKANKVFQGQNRKQTGSSCQVHWVWSFPTTPGLVHHPLYNYCTVSSYFPI